MNIRKGLKKMIALVVAMTFCFSTFTTSAISTNEFSVYPDGEMAVVETLEEVMARAMSVTQTTEDGISITFFVSSESLDTYYLLQYVMRSGEITDYVYEVAIICPSLFSNAHYSYRYEITSENNMEPFLLWRYHYGPIILTVRNNNSRQRDDENVMIRQIFHTQSNWVERYPLPQGLVRTSRVQFQGTPFTPVPPSNGSLTIQIPAGTTFRGPCYNIHHGVNRSITYWLVIIDREMRWSQNSYRTNIITGNDTIIESRGGRILSPSRWELRAYHSPHTDHTWRPDPCSSTCSYCNPRLPNVLMIERRAFRDCCCGFCCYIWS